MNFTKKIIEIALIGTLFTGFSGCTKIAEPANVMSVDEVALDGYDPVAYFESSKAIKVGLENSYSHLGLQWYFQNSENRASFEADPQAYIPQFGGFCAYELADENLVLSNPEFWYIHNKKLYLFSDEDAKNEWFENISLILPQAQSQWDLLKNPSEEEEFEEVDDTFMKETAD